MVTGGPALAGSGRWSADPAAHLATHPWLPRSGSTSMWLAGHPYGEWGPFSLPWWEGRAVGYRWAAESQAQLSWLPPSLGAASSPPTSPPHSSRRVIMNGTVLEFPCREPPGVVPRGGQLWAPSQPSPLSFLHGGLGSLVLTWAWVSPRLGPPISAPGHGARLPARPRGLPAIRLPVRQGPPVRSAGGHSQRPPASLR